MRGYAHHLSLLSFSYLLILPPLPSSSSSPLISFLHLLSSSKSRLWRFRCTNGQRRRWRAEWKNCSRETRCWRRRPWHRNTSYTSRNSRQRRYLLPSFPSFCPPIRLVFPPLSYSLSSSSPSSSSPSFSSHPPSSSSPSSSSPSFSSHLPPPYTQFFLFFLSPLLPPLSSPPPTPYTHTHTHRSMLR